MRSSVRPLLTNSKELSDGPRVVAGRRGRDRGSSKLCSGYAPPCKHGSRPVFPVADDGREEPVFGAPEEMVAHDEQEDVKTPPCLPSVYQPTRSEYLDHCITHYPFRAWCKHCLEGRGREFGHDNRRGDKDERCTPVISFDYCFVSDHGEVTTEAEFEAAGDGAVKVLVARDSRSKSVFAHAVPSKGVDAKGFAVSALVGDVQWLGYNRVVLKSDNEPAIVKLLREALRELRIRELYQCLEEHSPEFDPSQRKC